MERINERLLNWASILEDTTREQAERTAAMPFIHPHLALMPDAHLGKGATVGSVIPTDGAIIPAAVGVDIGCGMMAVRTQFEAADLRGDLAVLHGWIARAVPLSAGRYNKKPTATAEPRIAELRAMPGAGQADAAAPNWPQQLGSLGSGNHFIEVSLDESDRVWLFLHSGSRGVGNKLAAKHIAIAQARCRDLGIELADRDLAYLEEGTPEFDRYIEALRWAQRFAFLNREEMMDRVVDQLGRFVKTPVERIETVNCFAGETGVITRTGTRPIESLAGGEHELLTAGGEWVKAPVRSFGRQEVSEVLLSRSGVTKIIRATAGHRWLLRSRRGHEYEATTAELTPGDRLQFSFPHRPDGLTVDRRSAARGFVYGDGTALAGGRRALANFCGPKDQTLLPFFEGIGRPPRTYGPVTRVSGLPGAWKTERPSLDSPADELYGWLAGYFAADGDVDTTGRPTLSSADREDLEYVRLACQAIGVGTFGIRSRLRKGFGEVPTSLHLVGLMRGDLDGAFFLIPEHRARFERGRHASERRGWNVVSVRPTGETTEVYCAVVDGTHSFALADNILTRNCHHNYTERETHYGREVWLSRKGAISARSGQWGLIPGSMGTASYVVVGKGNPESLASSPHGAGRNFSRTAARKRFTRADLEKRMTGIAWGHSDAFLDEHPDAYKPIDRIMEDAADLVEIRHTLRQIVNVKGD
ncbi:RtcB family protein [Blastococcus sp. TF02A-26]|uniref:RtcB family protein n=1 Tax=Blastococcus sp. TF02A-26 TaxID=2250577 RepID=UPI001F1C6CF4|nr:RtcB family protein [Blastococcus sp. TF02A-26]